MKTSTGTPGTPNQPPKVAGKVSGLPANKKTGGAKTKAHGLCQRAPTLAPSNAPSKTNHRNEGIRIPHVRLDTPCKDRPSA